MLLTRGDEDDARGTLQRPWRLSGEGFDRRDAIEAGHADVEEQHVGGSIAERGENGRTAPAFRRELELGVSREQRAQAGASEGLVIGDQDLPGASACSESSTRARVGRSWTWPPAPVRAVDERQRHQRALPPPGGRSSASVARAP